MAVALYARVSTAKQAEKDLSIPDQLRQMREWCKRTGKPSARSTSNLGHRQPMIGGRCSSR